MGQLSILSIVLAPTDPYEISRLIDSLKPKYSSGHNGTISKLIKDIKYDISLPITILINKFLNAGIVPDLLKTVGIIYIYIAKNKEQLTNYRPISLLPTISKILENIIHKWLTYFLISQSVIYQSQYGFETKHTTTHALIQSLIIIRIVSKDKTKYRENKLCFI